MSESPEKREEGAFELTTRLEHPSEEGVDDAVKDHLHPAGEHPRLAVVDLAPTEEEAKADSERQLARENTKQTPSDDSYWARVQKIRMAKKAA